MRSFLFRSSVALVAFLVGVTTAAAFAALFGIGALRERARPSYAPQPPRTYSCPSQRRSQREAPEPPPPPAAPSAPQQTRVVIHGPDGAVRVVESQTTTTTERR
jgi:hypothetical protein